jgi:hypothetical protein
MAFTEETLRSRFGNHKLTGNKVIYRQEIKDGCLSLALLINEKCPDSREQSLAFTQLEQVMMWSLLAIERNDEVIIQEEKEDGRDSAEK